jgi:hypothetical protein
MITLRDGPAKGVFMVKRAPVYLRAVVARDGTTDVLDQPDDTPSPGEKVHVYVRLAQAGQVHINASIGKGFYAFAEYAHLPAIETATLRNTARWLAWCVERAEANPDEWAKAEGGPA